MEIDGIFSESSSFPPPPPFLQLGRGKYTFSKELGVRGNFSLSFLCTKELKVTTRAVR